MRAWRVLLRALKNGARRHAINPFRIERGSLVQLMEIIDIVPLITKYCSHTGQVWLVFIVQGGFKDSYTEDHRLVSL